MIFGKLRKPLRGRLVRRMYFKSGMLYLPCEKFFLEDIPGVGHVLLLMDTGTTGSILRKDFADMMFKNWEDIAVSCEDILTVSGMHHVKKLLWIPFTDGNGRQFRDDFLILDECRSLEHLSKETDAFVAGILGTDFMAKHGIIINFKTKEITL